MRPGDIALVLESRGRTYAPQFLAGTVVVIIKCDGSSIPYLAKDLFNECPYSLYRSGVWFGVEDLKYLGHIDEYET